MRDAPFADGLFELDLGAEAHRLGHVVACFPAGRLYEDVSLGVASCTAHGVLTDDSVVSGAIVLQKRKCTYGA